MTPGTRRFVVAHMLAYGVALPWGVAAVPLVFLWKEAELLAYTDEEAAVRLVVKLTLVPVGVAFVVPHLTAIPWVRSAKAGTHRGRTLFAASSIALAVIGIALSVVGWLRLVRP